MTSTVGISEARALAERLLAARGTRVAHVRGVAGVGEAVCASLSIDRVVLVAAAWLHDIGYAHEVVDTGFHPLDGARFLRRRGVDERVVSLVAHHSCAVLEAEERGLDGALLLEFARPPQGLADALLYCDMTTGPAGDRVSVGERLAEIRVRYGSGHVVTRFIDRAEPQLLAAVDRVERQLGVAVQSR